MAEQETETETRLREVLELELNVHERKLHARLIDELLRTAHLRPILSIGPSGGDDEDEGEETTGPRIQAYLRNAIQSAQGETLRLRKRESEFNVAFARTIAEEDRRQLILDFARDLGASKKRLRGDARAFARWFGEDAVKDRFLRRLTAVERKLAFYLDRFGVVSASLLRGYSGREEKRYLWERLGVEETVKPLLAYEGDARVVLAAFRALSRALRELPIGLEERSVDEATLQFIYRSAMQAKQDVWIQCEALSLLQSLSRRSFLRVLERRLTQPGEDDDLFLRRRAVKLLGANLRSTPSLERLVPAVARDPSPFVRQALAGALANAPMKVAEEWLRRLALDDGSPQVRAAAVCESLRLLESPEPDLRDLALHIVYQSMFRETDSFVLRVATHAAADGFRFLHETGGDLEGDWRSAVLEGLAHLHTSAGDLAVRRWAAQARERIWCAGDERAAEIERWLSGATVSIPSGKSLRIAPGVPGSIEDDGIGRVLALLGQDGFGYDCRSLRRHLELTKGNCFRFRLWRVLHELRHPSPDKRQAFPHTIARVFRGSVRAPSALLSELAETKVPGEPLFIPEEQGWRPFLPLVDDVLSSLDQRLGRKPVRFYTSEGVTELVPPATIHRRVLAYLRLTSAFPRYARLRNWRSDDDGHPRAYVDSLRKLGFDVKLRPHRDMEGEDFTIDPAVARFFPAGLPLLGGELWDELTSYFVSVYENTLFELAVFAAVITLLFGGRHAVSNYTLRRARDSIPLVIGGWGTRGKSGTERLKAALLSALGYGFVSKTTGCEAMFLYAHPFGRTREMFLFRPYDKATIWEQRNVVRLASKLGVEVFLWECMGLTPSYVEILQRQWMRDDISTITNTYPDHEDLQGPAGINIPEVMCNFIAPDSTLFTSEEQMLPILAESAEKLNTTLYGTGWLEAGMLPNDVLQRFPYEEHPYNIALVLALAGELGIDHDFALKEMADQVVADIGVLKSYPIADIRRRRLEFTNGMSANERLGCLGNWKRLGFDKHDPVGDAGTWVVTVINNRADRIPRSRVFADIIVRDISADRHVLIGNNLLGLQGYIKEAWDEYAGKLSLWRRREDGSSVPPLETLEGFMRKLRLPFHEEHIRARLRAILEGQRTALDVEKLIALWRQPQALRGELITSGCSEVADEIADYVKDMSRILREYEELSRKVETHASPDGALDDEFRELLWKWFRWKLVIVEDYFATGEQVVDRVVSAVPPGLFARIMGLQNIKGTGLDFVYRWQAWETCHRACFLLRSADIREMERGLRDLSTFREFGLLAQEHVRETLEIVRRSPAAQREQFQAELASIEATFTNALQAVYEQLDTAGATRGHRWLQKLCSIVEEVFDAGDAIRRRRIADTIYKDLISERISGERAALELQTLNKRQKGGWLYQKLESAHNLLLRTKGLVKG